MNVTVREVIQHYEGYNPYPYKDIMGRLTIGYGYLLERGLPKDICDELLSRDITRCSRYLRETYRWYEELDDARQIALISMVYQLGEKGFEGFRKMISALERKDWEQAYSHALDSKWAQQTPRRAHSTAMVLLTGDPSWFYRGGDRPKN